HARQVHRRRRDGLLRRPDSAAGPPSPGGGGGREAHREPDGLERGARRARRAEGRGARGRQYGICSGGRHRVRPARGLHRPREHRERGRPARGLRRRPERDRGGRGDGAARERLVRVRAPRREAPQGPYERPEGLPREARRERRAGSPDVTDALSGLTFVTSNAGKAREAAVFLGREVAVKDVEVPEIQSLDFAEVVRAKAIVAAGALGVPVLVEDSGLAVEAWGGFPGPLTKWIAMGAAGQD